MNVGPWCNLGVWGLGSAQASGSGWLWTQAVRRLRGPESHPTRRRCRLGGGRESCSEVGSLAAIQSLLAAPNGKFSKALLTSLQFFLLLIHLSLSHNNHPCPSSISKHVHHSPGLQMPRTRFLIKIADFLVFGIYRPDEPLSFSIKQKLEVVEALL